MWQYEVCLLNRMFMICVQARESHQAAKFNKKQSSGSNLTLETDW